MNAEEVRLEAESGNPCHCECPQCWPCENDATEVDYIGHPVCIKCFINCEY
jgi:hypothetical protein